MKYRNNNSYVADVTDDESSLVASAYCTYRMKGNILRIVFYFFTFFDNNY